MALSFSAAMAEGDSPAQPPPLKTLEPIAPIPLDAPSQPDRVALGERLFGDVRLSGDSSRSCASCHPLDKGGMDAKPRAVATDGKARLRNTPTLFNVAFNFAFNWDGATRTLEDHAQRLLANPAVMDSKWPDLLARLAADPDYARLFAAAFADGLTQANVLSALAAFERSLATPNAPVDRYLRGEREALSEQERRGYELFKSYGCVACHQGMNIGGNLFQRFGVFEDPCALSAVPPQADVGRHRVTSAERDRGVFRVPSLRNVALTAPYFHDGRAPSLEVAVDTMARVQLGRQLDAQEVRDIVSFLHALTGEFRGKPLAAPRRGEP